MAISEKLSGDTVGVRLGQPYRQSTLGAVGNFFDREDVLGYLLLVPVLYTIVIQDLKLIAWRTPGAAGEPAATTPDVAALPSESR